MPCLLNNRIRQSQWDKTVFALQHSPVVAHFDGGDLGSVVDVSDVAVAEGLLEGPVHRVLAQPHGYDLALGLAGQHLELVRS